MVPWPGTTLQSWTPITPAEQAELDALFAEVDRLEGTSCCGCGRELCGHASVIAIQMGAKDAPRCVVCLAQALELPTEDFLGRAVDFLARRDCYRTAWLRAGVREGQADPMRPACLWQAWPTAPAAHTASDRTASTPPAVVHWDLGDEGCGDLALALRRRMADVGPGGLVVIHATDPGAVQDIPAWCRLAGHALLELTPPTYRVRKKS